MRLDQFDKLHILVKELLEKASILKQENSKLNLENQKLKEKLSVLESNPNQQGFEELNKLKKENELLKLKNNDARTHLSQLINKVEGNIVLEKGVG